MAWISAQLFGQARPRLWQNKTDAERHEKEIYPKIYEIVKPFLTTPVIVKHFTVETTLCEHFAQALVA